MARLRHRVAKSEKPEDKTGVHRLSHIRVEEVSIVDRPANQRVFLVVKADDKGGSEPPPAPEPKPAAAAPLLKISAADKQKFTTALKAITDKVAVLTKALEGAEVVEGAATPEDVTKAIAEIGQLLGVDVEKSGRKISTARLEAMRQAHALLGQVIDEADPPAVEPAAEPAAKAAAAAAPAAPAAPAAVAVTPAIEAALKKVNDSVGEVAATVGIIVKAVATQKKRIDELAGSDTGGSRQVPVEKSKEGERGDEDVDTTWPIDMNRPFKRETTPVEKSFFQQQ